MLHHRDKSILSTRQLRQLLQREAIVVSATFVDLHPDRVFGIGPANRPKSPSPSGVAQVFSLIPVDSVGEVTCVFSVRWKMKKTQERMESKEGPTMT